MVKFLYFVLLIPCLKIKSSIFQNSIFINCKRDETYKYLIFTRFKYEHACPSHTIHVNHAFISRLVLHVLNIAQSECSGSIGCSQSDRNILIHDHRPKLSSASAHSLNSSSTKEFKNYKHFHFHNINEKGHRNSSSYAEWTGWRK